MVPLITYAMLGTSRQLGVGPVALVSLLVEVGLKGVLTEDECPEYFAQKNDTSLASESDWQLQSELCPDEYAQLAFLTSFLMGLFQIGAGFLRLGFLVSFLAHPVISGFTSAAAIIIGLSQLQYFMGFKIPKSQYIYEVLIHLFKKIDQTEWKQVPLGLASTHFDSLRLARPTGTLGRGPHGTQGRQGRGTQGRQGTRGTPGRLYCLCCSYWLCSRLALLAAVGARALVVVHAVGLA